MSLETVRPAFAGRARPIISYGTAFPIAVSTHITDTFNASRVYLICSGSLARNTDTLELLAATVSPDKLVGRRIGMKSHTLWSEVLEIVQDARVTQANLLLTIGGGTLTDAAKIVALALENGVYSAAELETLAEGPRKRPNIKAPTVPIISVPTSLSAGEYSNFAGGVEDYSKRKFSFLAPLRGPELIILDPKLGQTTPSSIWLSTGGRAIDHCVETLCALVGTTAASDELAQRALGLLVPGLIRCKKDRNDLAAYLQCQLGSVDAMAACTSGAVELGASHGIGHQLGPLGIGHGETSCILLPAVCKYNAEHGADNRYHQETVRQFLLKDPVVSQVLQARSVNVDSSDLGDILDAIIRELGMPRSLRDVGIGPDQLDRLAENSLHDKWCQTNPVPLTKKSQVLEILEMVV